MRNVVFILLLLILSLKSSDGQIQNNTIQSWSESDSAGQTGSLLIGGYGEVHYNQHFGDGTSHNGNLDVHRMVLLLGYRFDSDISFFSEIEFEHVKELFVEQAFLQYHISSAFNIKAGLLLIPMGIVNEYHEPTLFFGVERPLTDNLIVPSTWREIGAGISGNLTGAAMKYQLYLINGFLGYNGHALLNGTNGLRGGRQKGAKSSISSPNLTGKVTWYGIPGLKLGTSFFTGRSESTLFAGLDKDDKNQALFADSSTVFITMTGLDLKYEKEAFHFKAQLNYVLNKNTEQYNSFGKSDLGETLFGYYLEAGYNLLNKSSKAKKLFLFGRYEHVNTHNTITTGTPDSKYNMQIITTGLSYLLNQGAVIKADFQLPVGQSAADYSKQLNLGIGVWFR